MAHSKKIILHRFGEESGSGLFPANDARKYSQLENFAFSYFKRNRNSHSLHFHDQNEDCEGEIVESVWNSSGYFNDDFCKDGRLHLFAHFEATEEPDIVRGRRRERSCSPEPQSYRSITGRFSAAPKRTLADSTRDEEGESAVPKRMKKQPPSQSGSEEPCMTDKYAILLATYASENAPRGTYGHKSNWNDLGDARRKEIAHARLIRIEPFGIRAPNPCAGCLKEGTECRIYRAGFGDGSGTCGECRLRERECVKNGRSRRQPRPSKKVVENATLPEPSEATRSKKRSASTARTRTASTNRTRSASRRR